MITSNLPWSIKLNTANEAEILDASGNLIGVMYSYQDAEFLINFKDDLIENLESEVNDLGGKVEELEGKLEP
jgi:hypothetical protein